MIRRVAYRLDKDTVIRLVYNELYPFTRSAFPGRRFSRKDILHRLRVRDAFVYIGRNAAPDGFIMVKVDGGSLFIDMLAVDKRKQGQGTGRSLMLYAERFGKGKGLRTARLFVDASNLKAIRFYEKIGYGCAGYYPQLKCFLFQKDLQ